MNPLTPEFDRIFAPIIIFNFHKFKVLADLEETMKVNVDFNINMMYFNSDIFLWEPFIEDT